MPSGWFIPFLLAPPVLFPSPFIYLELDKLLDSSYSSQLDIFVVIHHLLVRGNPSLPLPHSMLKVNEEEYLQWIDSHTELEWISMIKDLLRDYVDVCDQSGAKSYHPVYPNIIKCLTLLEGDQD